MEQQPLYKILPLDFNPQHIEKKFKHILVSSKFDSGNLQSVSQQKDDTFILTISPDCSGINQEYIYRTWFHFKVSGARNERLNFLITNMNNQLKLFQDGYKIVYYKNNSTNYDNEYVMNEEYNWKRLEGDINVQVINFLKELKEDKTLDIKFYFDFTEDYEVYFAFCYPWSYTKNQKLLEYFDQKLKNDKEIYYHREYLVNSKENRRLDLITISSYDQITKMREPVLKGLFPDNKNIARSYMFSKDKPIIFITGRVHPGETPGSYMMNGIIKFLLDKNNILSKLLRKFFVFKIVPIINVDGVYRGYYRYDTNSFNMNRHYVNPNPKILSEIYAIKRIFLFYNQEKKVKYYFDLHGHVSSRGLFLYANSLDFLPHCENYLFPKIYEINCKYFCLENCIFSEKSMKSKEKGDLYSKEGCGRVHFYKCTQLTHCYTIEASYFRGINVAKNTEYYKDFSCPPSSINNLKSILGQNKINIDFSNLTENNNSLNLSQDNNEPSQNQNNIEFYHPKSYEKMGRQLVISVLDYEELNPFSKVFSSEFQNVYNIRRFISLKLYQEDSRFKNNALIQNLIKDINYVKTFTSLYEKFSLKLENKTISIYNTVRNKDSRRPLEEINLTMKNSTRKESIPRLQRDEPLTPDKNKSSILLFNDGNEKNKHAYLHPTNLNSIKEENTNILSKDDNFYVKKNYVNLTLSKKTHIYDIMKVEKQKLPVVKPHIISHRLLPSKKNDNLTNTSFSKGNEMNLENNIKHLLIKNSVKNSDKKRKEKVVSLKDLPYIKINSRQPKIAKK